MRMQSSISGKKGEWQAIRSTRPRLSAVRVNACMRCLLRRQIEDNCKAQEPPRLIDLIPALGIASSSSTSTSTSIDLWPPPTPPTPSVAGAYGGVTTQRPQPANGPRRFVTRYASSSGGSGGSSSSISSGGGSDTGPSAGPPFHEQQQQRQQQHDGGSQGSGEGGGEGGGEGEGEGYEHDGPAVRAALAALRFYRTALSPLMAPACRYLPTCSAYAAESYRRHGAWRGTVLTAWRLLRCNPWGGSGYDPPTWPPVGLPRAAFALPYSEHAAVVLGAALALRLGHALLFE